MDMEEMNLNDLQSVLDELKPKKEARMSEDFKAKVMKEARRQYGLEKPKRRVIGRYSPILVYCCNCDHVLLPLKQFCKIS